MLGHLIYSYNHLDDARIQQEISRKLYAPVFGAVYSVHVHNGKKSFNYTKYLEDVLIRRKNKGHFQGASDLINCGVIHCMKSAPAKVRYLLITAADTWCINVHFINKIIKEMYDQKKVLAVSAWSRDRYPIQLMGFSLDFCIIDIKWFAGTAIFPLRFTEFKNKFLDQLALWWKMPNLELTFQYQFNKYFMRHYQDNNIWQERDRLIRRIIEREPVHRQATKTLPGGRKDNWPALGIYSNPEPTVKQKVLKAKRYALGRYAKKLVEAKSLNWYNNYS